MFDVAKYTRAHAAFSAAWDLAESAYSKRYDAIDATLTGMPRFEAMRALSRAMDRRMDSIRIALKARLLEC